jgi:hypothetical protein
MQRRSAILALALAVPVILFAGCAGGRTSDPVLYHQGTVLNLDKSQFASDAPEWQPIADITLTGTRHPCSLRVLCDHKVSAPELQVVTDNVVLYPGSVLEAPQLTRVDGAVIVMCGATLKAPLQEAVSFTVDPRAKADLTQY